MIFGPITAIRWTELEVVRVTKEERNIEATIDEGVRVMVEGIGPVDLSQFPFAAVMIWIRKGDEEEFISTPNNVNKDRHEGKGAFRGRGVVRRETGLIRPCCAVFYTRCCEYLDTGVLNVRV